MEDFDEDADQSEGKLSIEQPRAQPVTVDTRPPATLLSEEEVEQRCAAARQDGFAAGYAAGERQAASEHLSICSKLTAALDTVESEAGQRISEDIELLANTALSLLVEYLPAFCARRGEEEVRAALRSVFSSLVDEPRLVVEVAANLETTIRSDLIAVGGRADRMTVVVCPDMLPGDLRLTWDQGSVSRDARHIRRLMLDQLARLGFLAATEKDMPDDVRN